MAIVKKAVKKKSTSPKKKAAALVSKKRKVTEKKSAITAASKKSAVKKKVIKVSIKKAKKPAKKKQKKTELKKSIAIPVEIIMHEEMMHGEDKHLIPVSGEIHLITHQERVLAENQFHHREDVFMHQENLKAKSFLASRKGARKGYRNPRQS